MFLPCPVVAKRWRVGGREALRVHVKNFVEKLLNAEGCLEVGGGIEAGLHARGRFFD